MFQKWLTSCFIHKVKLEQLYQVAAAYSQKNISEILLNQTEIRLYLPFPDRFWTKRWSVWFQINRKMVNTIWFRIDLIKLQKDFSVCRRWDFLFLVNTIQTFIEERLIQVCAKNYYVNIHVQFWAVFFQSNIKFWTSKIVHYWSRINVNLFRQDA